MCSCPTAWRPTLIPRLRDEIAGIGFALEFEAGAKSEPGWDRRLPPGVPLGRPVDDVADPASRAWSRSARSSRSTTTSITTSPGSPSGSARRWTTPSSCSTRVWRSVRSASPVSTSPSPSLSCVPTSASTAADQSSRSATRSTTPSCSTWAGHGVAMAQRRRCREGSSRRDRTRQRRRWCRALARDQPRIAQGRQ